MQTHTTHNGQWRRRFHSAYDDNDNDFFFFFFFSLLLSEAHPFDSLAYYSHLLLFTFLPSFLVAISEFHSFSFQSLVLYTIICRVTRVNARHTTLRYVTLRFVHDKDRIPNGNLKKERKRKNKKKMLIATKKKLTPGVKLSDGLDNVRVCVCVWVRVS